MFTLEEFESYLQLEPGEVNNSALDAMKREAKVLISGIVPGVDFNNPPENVQVVALRMVARGYSRGLSDAPYGATSVQQSAGAFSRSFGFESGSTQPGLWLTKQDKRDLRGGSRGGAYTIDLGPVNPPYFGGVDPWFSQ